MGGTIKDMNDIRLLVDTFYERMSKDALLAPVFFSQVEDLARHKETMYKFWQTMFLDESTYQDALFQKHEALPLMNQHVVRWLTLFLATIDDLYSGPSAEQAKLRAIKIAEVFRYKLNLTRF